MDNTMALSLSPVIAHRGDRLYAPENTLAAIRQAAAKGAKWVEFDATLTLDTSKPVVIFHDDRVGRTTNLPDQPLADIAFDELRAADAGSWFAPAFAGERVPTLAEMMALCRELGLGMNIEIKVSSNGNRESPEPFDDALAGLTAQRVLEDMGGAGDGVLISSFSTTALLYAKEHAPLLPRGYLLHKLWPDEAEFRRRLRAIDPATLNLNEALLPSPEAVAGFRAIMKAELDRALPILAYTVNDAARAKNLWEWGVSAVFTDCPGDLPVPPESTGA